MSKSSSSGKYYGIPVPAASRRTHLGVAAALWSVVGLALFTVGLHWMLASHSRWLPALLAAALIAGWAKARYLLRRPARRTIGRIEARGDSRCIGGFLSWKSWLLILCMILLGRALRLSPLPVLWRGAIYAAIGTALFAGSVPIWRHLRSRSG